jgi:hypothetical protein
MRKTELDVDVPRYFGSARDGDGGCVLALNRGATREAKGGASFAIA